MMSRVMVCALLLLVSATSEAKPKFTQSDVDMATTQEQQVALYQALSDELARKSKGSRAKSYQELQTQLGNTLANDESRRIRAEVTGARLGSGVVPMSVLNAADDAARPIQTWNPQTYANLMGELARERSLTEDALAKNKAMQSEIDSSDWVQQVAALREQWDLFGDDAAAESAYESLYEEGQRTLKASGDRAMRSGEYGAALDSYETLEQLNPEFPGVGQLVSSASAATQAQAFQDMLLNGNIEGAYDSFEAFSQQPMTPSQKNEYFTPASSLADYFSGLADNSVNSGQYSQAYSSIKREMKIRGWLDMPSQISDSTRASFTEAMFDLSVASSARDNAGLEYGFLLLVEEFNPHYPSLESLKREAAQTVYENAIRRVGSVSLASADPASQPIASQIAAGVGQYLMAHVPEDVKIVERERLDEIRRERGMDTSLDSLQEPAQLESADFLIEGELTSADVETVVKKTRNTERVVTGHEEVTNPAFEDWIREKGKRKADHPDAPPKTISRPVLEDVSLNIEEHQKDGVVGVTYRIIDTRNAEQIHAESITKSMRVSDMASEGIRLGEYVKEARLAELPSDREIFNQLAGQVVADMGGDLIGFLANPDGDYFENCKLLAADDHYEEAAENCANAAVLRQYREQDNSEIIPELKWVTLNSGMRAD